MAIENAAVAVIQHNGYNEEQLALFFARTTCLLAQVGSLVQ